MKKISSSKNNYLFIICLIFFILIVYWINQLIKNNKIDTELELSLKELKLNLDITSFHNKKLTDSIYNSFKRDEKVLQILSEVLNTDTNRKNILRKELYLYLFNKFELMTTKGINMLLFSDPDNKTLLRMHNINMYDDDLSEIRKSIVYVNKIKKEIHGFEEGKIAHGFRNVYPLYYKDKYVGCFDVSFSSHYIQDTLSKINKVHSHFLIKKDLFSSKNWKQEEIISSYRTSIENENYLVSLDEIDFAKETLYLQQYLLSMKEEIYQKMKMGLEFSIYETSKSNNLIISFLPIHSLNGNKIAAYIVSYTHKKIGSLIRKTDTFARWGGEEFVVLLPSTKLEQAVQLAKKLKTSIEELTHDKAGHFTASFGVTEFVIGEDSKNLFKRCDIALYQAKKNGRNKVEYIKHNEAYEKMYKM